MNSIEQRAAAYLAKMPPAIAGQGGHAATFAAACRLVEFGLTFEQAAPLLAAWNETHCEPRWTEAELRHKLADAFKRTAPKPHLASGAARPAQRSFSPMSKQRATNQNACNRILERRFPAKCVSLGEKARGNEIAAGAATWHEGTEADFTALATLRGLSVEGVALASARGLLRFGRFHGREAWFALDASQRCACARRMDGEPWHRDGAKSLLLRGSQATRPLGIGEARDFRVVLLCEGAPDLLAAFHFIAAARRVTDCAPVAMLSAHYRIPGTVLPMFAGKRVRIYAHNDGTGYMAASRWAAQLEPHADKVDAFSFAGVRTRDGVAVNDLNDFAHAENSEANTTLLANLIP